MDGARSFKVVFPHTTNHHNTMFGGEIISMMVEVAFMTATRFTRQRLVIVAVERIDFAKPIPAGTIVEAVGSISKIGNTSLAVTVEVFRESMYEEGRQMVTEGNFKLVALDDHDRPVRLSAQIQVKDVSNN
jgi:acyl-CoA hydrolase